jgi:hypothetical protein
MSYQELYTSFAAGIILCKNGKFTMGKLKSKDALIFQ